MTFFYFESVIPLIPRPKFLDLNAFLFIVAPNIKFKKTTGEKKPRTEIVTSFPTKLYPPKICRD